MKKKREILFPLGDEMRLKLRLRKMKLTVLMTFMVMASFGNSFSQVTLSVSFNKANIHDVLTSIEQKTDYIFMYRDNILDDSKTVSADFQDAKFEEVLKSICEQIQVDYEVRERQIILTERADQPTPSEQQQTPKKTISGQVSDSKGNTLPGVSVVVKGTTIGIISDADGKFVLAVPANATALVFSFIGMKTQEVSLGNNTTVKVTLAEETVAIEEVVAVGYGTQKKTNLTGSVTQVKMEDILGDRPLVTVAAALQGSVPGLTVVNPSTPGGTPTFNIRGITSINGGGPLVLIDNAEGDINMINPEDIESISVLKDAASTAIYGARAAFGVILVSTKKAKKNSKPVFNYNDNFAFTKPINKVEQAPVKDILQTYANWSPTPTTGGPEGQDFIKWVQYAEDFLVNPANYPADGRYISPDDSKYYFLRDNDPQNAIFDNHGFQQTHNLSATGGGDKITYRMSAGVVSNDGPLITSKDQYKRLNIGSFVNADLTSWMSSSLDIKYNTSEKTLVSYGRIYTPIPRFYPVGTFASKIDGNSYPTSTPENYLLYGNPDKNTRKETRIFSRTVITPFKGMEGIVEYTMDDFMRDDKSFTQSTTMVEMNRNSAPSVAVPIYSNTKGNNAYTALNAYASYTYDTGNNLHHFKVLGGYSQERSYNENLNANRKEVINADLPSISGAAGEILADDSFTDYTIRSGFFRANYNFKDKYLFEANGRYDGSSRFPSENRFGFFPSASVGWNVSRENFMNFSKKWLNEFKLRGSWGQIGNQNIAAYGYSPKMDPTRADWIVGITKPATIGMPPLVRQDYTWEVVETQDLGADFAFLNNRLQATADVYIRKTTGMLAPGMEYPAVVGTGAPLQNAADLENRGWELSAGWKDKIGKVAYRIGFNVYDSQTEITDYNNVSKLLGTGYYVGQKLGEIWGYRNDGFYTIDDFKDGWQTNTWALKDGVTSIKGTAVRPGDNKYKNLIDKGTSVANQIDAGMNTVDDPGDREIIGNSTARYFYGINGGVSYSGFDFSFIISGVGKRDVWSADELAFPLLISGAYSSNVYSHQLDYWQPVDRANNNYTPVNANAKYARLYNSNENNTSNIRIQDKYLLNGAYLRLRNVTLAYNLPAQIAKKAGLTAIKLFTSLENPLTFSHLEKGRDPESLGWSYPFYSTTSFGLNVTF